MTSSSYTRTRGRHVEERSLPLKDAIAVGVVQVFIINDVGMSFAPKPSTNSSNSMPFARCIVITWARPLAPTTARWT